MHQSLNSIRTVHVLSTMILAVPMLILGVSEVIMNPPGQLVETLIRLGYPLYLFRILGLSSALGGMALLADKNETLKEWAYAGFSFLFLGAAASHTASYDTQGVAAPVVMLTLLAFSYASWKQLKDAERNRMNELLQYATLKQDNFNRTDAAETRKTYCSIAS